MEYSCIKHLAINQVINILNVKIHFNIPKSGVWRRCPFELQRGQFLPVFIVIGHHTRTAVEQLFML